MKTTKYHIPMRRYWYADQDNETFKCVTMLNKENSQVSYSYAHVSIAVIVGKLQDNNKTPDWYNKDKPVLLVY